MSINTDNYICPETGQKLQLNSGKLVSNSGATWEIDNRNIPNFLDEQGIGAEDKASLDWYKVNAIDYDQYLPLTFETFDVDEDQERQKMIDALEIKQGDTILEIGAGTGRDTEKLLSSLQNGEIFIQDISSEILSICYDKLSTSHVDVEKSFFISNASNLPLPDNKFDRVFHFGGLNTFSNRKEAIREIIRVAKPGAKVVIGDENMPVWLRNTEFGQVLMNSNPHYSYEIPFVDLPIEARNVKVEWIIGGVFYFITFDVAESAPKANIDFEIPGVRGGTHRTRFYGQLEGVGEKNKTRIYNYARENKTSVSAVLEQLISSLD
ncbi:methyltransferase domain-containing protein [Amylibacter sp.]|nr:methyltransferase domain-containing protein [Amylibacter sp.]